MCMSETRKRKRSVSPDGDVPASITNTEYKEAKPEKLRPCTNASPKTEESDGHNKSPLASISEQKECSVSSEQEGVNKKNKKKEVSLSTAFLTQQMASPPDISTSHVATKLSKMIEQSHSDPYYTNGKGKRAPVLMYLLQTHDKKGTYTGIANNLRRRMGSHNYCEIRSSAYTARGGRPWSVVATVKGFETREVAEQFEKLVKTYPCDSLHHVSAVDNRLYRVLQVCRALAWDPLLLEVDSYTNFTCLDVFPLPDYCRVERVQWMKPFNAYIHKLKRQGWLDMCKQEGWEEDGSPATSKPPLQQH